MLEDKIIQYIDEVEALKESRGIFPVTFEVDLTNRCQNKCSFCVSEGNLNGSDMDYHQYKKFIIEAVNNRCKSITFTGGGEPTLHPKFDEFVNFTAPLAEVGLITNGLLLHRWKAVLDKFTFIRVSLDAGTRETYKRLKNNEGFDLAVENLLMAADYCDCVGVSFVVNDDNVEDIEACKDLFADTTITYVQTKVDIKTNKAYMGSKRKKSIYTKRYPITSDLPCKIAGLVGICQTNFDLAYCCLKRYVPNACIGNYIKEEMPLKDFYAKIRPFMDISWRSCVTCRYTNYAKRLEELEPILIKHRRFL